MVDMHSDVLEWDFELNIVDCEGQVEPGVHLVADVLLDVTKSPVWPFLTLQEVDFTLKMRLDFVKILFAQTDVRVSSFEHDSRLLILRYDDLIVEFELCDCLIPALVWDCVHPHNITSLVEVFIPATKCQEVCLLEE